MLVLASTSETRKRLLQQAGIAFTAVAAGVNEREIEASMAGEGNQAGAVARALAAAKALAVEGRVVVGSDQVLALGDELLHKVTDSEAAIERLLLLSGRTHELHTAVALAVDGRLVWQDVAVSRLTMRAFDRAEATDVVAADPAVVSAAGAYRIEGPAIRLFAAIDGDYSGILGLPLLVLLDALRRHAPETLARFT